MTDITPTNAKKAHEPKAATSKQVEETGLSIGVQLAETAWRIAIPFLTLTLGGAWLDGVLNSSPLLTLTGMLTSLLIIGFVLHRYIEIHYPDTFKRGKK